MMKEYSVLTASKVNSNLNNVIISNSLISGCTVIGTNLCVSGPLKRREKGIRGEGAADRKYILPIL
jgi:hypothetical protein